MPRISPGSEAQNAIGPLSEKEKRDLVQRVINSHLFRRAPALRDFLLYVTDQEILGQADKLKEHTIGVVVLGRKPDYIPTSDNIVRVRAHELRGRLERYFASEGANEPYVITMPVGGYAPNFALREPTASNVPVAAPDAEAVPQADGKKRRRHYSWLLIAAIAIVALSVAIVGRVIRSDRRTATAEGTAAVQDFWGPFFDKPDKEFNVVYSDPGFALWQDWNNKTLSLGDYLNREYLNPESEKQWKAALRPRASISDIEVVGHLGTVAGRFGGQLNIQFSRDINTNFLKQGNLILLGSRRSNPWVELYEPSLNFRLEVDPHSSLPSFRNRSPQPNEAPSYAIPTMTSGSGDDDKQYIGYGLAALLKSCGSHQLTVIIEGLNAQGTEAVGDELTDPHRLSALLRSIGHTPGTTVAPFEALIQFASFRDSEYDNPKVIAFRIQPPGSCVGN